MLKVEVVVRNVLAGSTAKKFGIEEGTPLEKPLVEFYYKEDSLADPFISDDQALMMKVVKAQTELDELKKRLAALPEKSVVLYLSFFLDSAGDTYSGPEALSMFAPVSSAPIYGTSETYMGAGIVGGNLIDFEALGKRTVGLTVEAVAPSVVNLHQETKLKIVVRNGGSAGRAV